MSGVVCVVSTGVCACSGVGASNAFTYALGGSNDAFAPLTVFESPRHHNKFVGVARGFDSKKYSKLSHCGKILFAAIEDALEGADLSSVDRSRVSMFFGTSIGGIFEAENMLARNLNEPESCSWNALRDYECSTIAEYASKHFAFSGECATYSTACSSSSLAISDACNAIIQGDCDVAIVCGADSLSRITVNGFGSLLLLSQGRSRPFDVNRDGINLGECAGVLILASEEIATKLSHRQPMAYINGWACSADSYHATAPHPEGEGASRAIASAITSASISASDISYYNAHGTGTKGNDSAEFSAMKKVFGQIDVAYSSVKRAFGHTLGASGVLNVILTIESMRRSQAIVNLGFESLGEGIDREPIRKTGPLDICNALCVSLGFGGNNSATVVSKTKCVEKEHQKKRLFVYSYGSVCPFEVGKNIVEFSDLLKDIAPLKKRRWAKLQQIALDSSVQALTSLKNALNPERTAVCFGTGMGMVSETQRFIESVIKTNEAEPLPSAFTNSVHNAPSSAVSLMFGLKGLNSASTAKEISFESALKQAWREINSSASDSALVGACDEYSKYGQNFLNESARFCRDCSELSDMGVAYLVSAQERLAEQTPIAEILDLKISRLSHCKNAEENFVKDFLSEHFQKNDFLVLLFGISNKHRQSLVDRVFANISPERIINASSIFGRNYSASGFAIKYALEKLSSLPIASYSLSSSGMRSICAFKSL